jgi:hypothetical protein
VEELLKIHNPQQEDQVVVEPLILFQQVQLVTHPQYHHHKEMQEVMVLQIMEQEVVELLL